MTSLLRWTSNQSNSLVFCPCWPLNSLWLQMNWKHNTAASVWHFPLLGRVNPYLCQRRPARQRIATATSVPSSALHAWKHHLLLALPINKPLVDENEQLKWSAASQHAPSPPNLRLHQRDHLFQPFFCSIGHEAGRAPLLLLHWGGIIGGDKHHYNVPQWVLHLNLHVIAWGGGGLGGVVSMCRPVFSCSLSECPLQWIMHPSHFSCPPVLPEHHPLTGRTSGKEDWHRALAFCYHQKYSLLSRMTQRFIRMTVRIMWIRWVLQLSRLGCGSPVDYTDPITKNLQNSSLYWRPA